MRVLVFDTETTGLLPMPSYINPYSLHIWPTIVQLSYMVYDTDTHNINPICDHIIKVPDGIIIPEDAIKIHKISNRISRDRGVSIIETIKDFMRCVRSVDKLCGHNVINYDIYMIKIELHRIIHHNLVPHDQLAEFKQDLHYLNTFKNIYCTLQETIYFCNITKINKNGTPNPIPKYPKLNELHAKLFKNEPTNLHNSLNDVFVTLRCFVKLTQDIDLLEVSPLFKRLTKNIYGSYIEQEPSPPYIENNITIKIQKTSTSKNGISNHEMTSIPIRRSNRIRKPPSFLGDYIY